MIDRIAAALRRWQTWTWSAGLIGAAYVAYLLVSGLLTPASPVTPAENQMVMRGIVSQGRHGKNGWKFVADTSEISPDGYTTTYHNVSDASFARDGKIAYRLKASVVTVDSRNQNYSASGGVHAWSTEPTMPEDLQTQDAYWNESAQTLTCPAAARFIYDRTVLHTSHLTVNLANGAAQLGDTSIDYRATPGPSPMPKPLPVPTSANR